MPFRYPVALELSGRRCVVTGGGAEAERKARALLEAEADVVVIAPSVTDGLRDLVRRGELTHVPRRYERGDLTDRRHWHAACWRARATRAPRISKPH